MKQRQNKSAQRWAFVCLFLCCILGVSGQKLHRTGLLTCQLSKTTDGNYQVVGAPHFLSHFNTRGYNNQPIFFTKNEIYLTVQFPADTSQTDIVALDLAKNQFTRVTRTTPEAEYSPTPMLDGKHFSCVRVEADRSQQLWAYPLDRSHGGNAIFSKIKGVGYHCWLTDDLLALFMVGENGQPHELVAASRRDEKTTKIASNPGRCLQRLPDGRLAYVQKITDQTWFLKSYDVATKSYRNIATTPSGSEDFVCLPDGTFLMGSGSKLYALPPNTSTWLVAGDFSKFLVKKITRLAFDGAGQLVLVVE